MTTVAATTATAIHKPSDTLAFFQAPARAQSAARNPPGLGLDCELYDACPACRVACFTLTATRAASSRYLELVTSWPTC